MTSLFFREKWFLSAGEESEVRTGADFLAGEISVLTTPHPHPYHGNRDAYTLINKVAARIRSLR